jgi:spoIIIJ-associated protein
MNEQMAKAEKTLAIMLDYLGLEAALKTEEKTEDKISIIVSSDDAGRIIGRKGQALESLQLLLNRMMHKADNTFPRIYIDIDGYSKKGGRDDRRGDRDGDRRGDRRGPRREEKSSPEDEERLIKQALDAAKEVKRWGESVALPPMNSHDRRIIHVALREHEGIETESEGDGNMKRVIISLKN